MVGYQSLPGNNPRISFRFYVHLRPREPGDSVVQERTTQWALLTPCGSSIISQVSDYSEAGRHGIAGEVHGKCQFLN